MAKESDSEAVELARHIPTVTPEWYHTKEAQIVHVGEIVLLLV